MTRVLVTGGTGRAGRPVVKRLRDLDCDLRVLSHTREGVVDGVEYVMADLVRDDGTDEAVRGAEIIIHCAGAPNTGADQAMTANLVRAVRRLEGEPHLVPVAAGVRFQPVDTGEVASRLAELALGTPHGLAPDLGGPTAYPMADLLTGYLRTVGKRRLLVPVRLPGKLARIVRAGANLPAPGATLGHRTWEEFLGELRS
jgi:uncharacterized protein YbjT (DUF2867 family)